MSITINGDQVQVNLSKIKFRQESVAKEVEVTN